MSEAAAKIGIEERQVVYCPGCGNPLRELSEDTRDEGHFTRGSTLMVHLGSGRLEEDPPRPTYMGVCGGCGFAFDVLHRKTYRRWDDAGEAVPRHVAIVPDGNRRWAKRRRPENPMAGYGVGVERFFDLLGVAAEVGVRFITLYVLSTENWKRAEEETAFLSRVVSRAIDSRTDELVRAGVRVRFIGRRDGLAGELRDRMARLEKATAGGDGITLSIALNYGGQAEIADAARAVVEDGLAPAQVDEAAVARHLYAPEVPEVDLLIRSGGELRLSNFMLWRAAYAELYVTETLWPDFSTDHFVEALNSFSRRERRRGGKTASEQRGA